jgi:hypothetical protein
MKQLVCLLSYYNKRDTQKKTKKKFLHLQRLLQQEYTPKKKNPKVSPLWCSQGVTWVPWKGPGPPKILLRPRLCSIPWPT